MEATMTEVLNSLMPLLPALLGTWGQLGVPGVPLSLFLATAMLPFVVICGLILARSGRKSLYERSARQLAGLGNILNWLFLGCATAGFLVARPQLEALHGLYLFGVCLLLGLLAVGTLLWTVVSAAWKSLRKAPVVHALLAFLAGSCIAAVPSGGLLGAYLVLQNIVLPVQGEWQSFANILPFLPSVTDPFWLFALLMHFLEAAAAGGIGLLWLIFRRHVDDFGRDYYIFAANWCGTWGTYGAWVAFLMASGMFWFGWTQGIFLPVPGTILFSVGVLLSLFCSALLWTRVARSANPMRHKFSMALALFFYVAGIAAGGALLPLLEMGLEIGIGIGI